MKTRYNTIITFGTFDLFHIGHLNILKRAKALGQKLIVGISTDALNLAKKDILPIYNECDRLEIVKNIQGVDEVFFEESLDLKGEYIKKYGADALVMGDDWIGRFDWCTEFCEVIYLPRTPEISSTQIKEDVKRG
ncbi:adenylyltransferase/cytidyltransferase family protein [Pseudomonas promysalinigenes]